MLHFARKVGLLIALSAAAGFAASETLVLNNPTDPPLTNGHGKGFLDRLAQEAFRRAGLELKLVKLPAERALRNANTGIEDGDLNRIAGIERAYPNLVRIPEKNMDMQFSAFTRQPAPINVDWQQLSNHQVGVIKGWKIFEFNLRNPRLVVQVADAGQLFRLLAKDRVDFVLYSSLMGLDHLRKYGPGDAQLLRPLVETREMFIYLHKSRAHIVPLITAAMHAMKEDGTYDRFYRESIQ